MVVLVLGDLADDARLGQLLAGAAEGVAGGQLAGHRLVQAGVAQGVDQVGVADGDAGAGPGDDLAEQLRAGRDGRGSRWSWSGSSWVMSSLGSGWERKRPGDAAGTAVDTGRSATRRAVANGL